MGDNIVIYNENCSAGCNHCPYSMECMVRDDAFPESLYTINDIKSDFIILSGGEPFELNYDLLHKYTCMCLICKKIFSDCNRGAHLYSTIFEAIKEQSVLFRDTNRHRCYFRDKKSRQ